MVPKSTWRLFEVDGEAELAAAAGRLSAEAEAGRPGAAVSKRGAFAGGGATRPEAGLLRTAAAGTGRTLTPERGRFA